MYIVLRDYSEAAPNILFQKKVMLKLNPEGSIRLSQDAKGWKEIQEECTAWAKAQKHESTAVSETVDVAVVQNINEDMLGEACRASS